MPKLRSISGVALLGLLVVGLVGCGSSPTQSVPPAASSTPSVAPATAPPPSAIATQVGQTAAPTAAPTQAPPSPSQSGPAATGHTTTGQLPPELAGTFAVHLDLSDVSAPDEAGDWFLTLDAASGYQFGLVSRGFAENAGDLTVDATKISFSNESGKGACPAAPGTYTWKVERGTSALTLTVVSDGCDVRAAQNTAHPYLKCPAGPATCADVLKPTPSSR